MKSAIIYNVAITSALILAASAVIPSCKEEGEVQTTCPDDGQIVSRMQLVTQRVDNMTKKVEELHQTQEEILKALSSEGLPVETAQNNHRDAQAAFDMACSAKNVNDAFIYCMNALQKNAGNYDYYNFMSRLAENESDASILEQIERVMELGLYQVPAEKVASLADLLRTVQARLSTIEDGKNSEAIPQSTDKGSIDSLIQTSWSKIAACQDAKQVSKLCSERLELLQELSAEDSDYSEEIEKTVARTSFVSLESSIRSSVSNLRASMSDYEQVPESKLPSLEIDLQSVSGQMTQLCMLVMTAKPEWLPSGASEQKDQLCAEVDACRVLLGKARSVPVRRLLDQVVQGAECLDKDVCVIDEMYKKSISGQRGHYTKQLDEQLVKMRKLSMLVSKLEDKDCAREWSGFLSSINDKISMLQKQRNKAYQIWAVGKCSDARNTYAEKKDAGLSDSEAARAAINYHLRWVDVSLLAPQSADIYQNLLSTYKQKIEDEYMMDVEKELVETEKHALERL